jgi:hypothetical protein
MSIPEYVFLNRLEEFYAMLKNGQNLWKIDETLNFIDEKGREMIKKWIQDDKYPWTIGRGYSVLTQNPPIISLVVDADRDREAGQMIGNYAGQGIGYEPDGITPQEYWVSSARLKTGTFRFVLMAPNADMLSAMYCLLERAMYEGETPPVGEENIITFSDYGIGELYYSGSDLRPDESYVPTSAFARTLSVTCTYEHNWSGRIYGKEGFALSVDVGNVIAYDDEIRHNP